MKVLGFGLMWLCCSLAAPVVSACELRMRVSQFSPLTYQDANKKWTGLDVELTQALAEQLGCTLHFVDIPWKRALLSLAQGEIDVMANLSKTSQRTAFLYFVGPERDETIVLATPATQTFSLQTLDDFKRLKGRIGIQSGSFYGHAFDYKMQTDPAFADKFEAVPNDLDNLKKLERDRIIGYFADYYQISDQIRNSSRHRHLKIHPFIVNSDDVYFGFSKKSVDANVIHKAESALQTTELKTRFAHIITRYRIEPTATP